MRFLHLADVHLDTPFAGRSDPVRRRLREASREALSGAIDCAVAEQVHAVLLAGDVFDGERLSFQTERFLLEELGRLAEAGIQVVYATGNHDPGQDAHRTHSLAWPSNVVVVGDATPQRVPIRNRTGNDVGLVTAVGHASRRETRDLAAAFPSAGVDELPHVALLHTQVHAARTADEHERYAPSELPRLLASGHDYWALGHVHLRQQLADAPAIHYPGNLQGRTHRESGPKGGLLVELERRSAPTVEFRPFAPVRFETVVVDGLEEADSLDRLLARFRAAWQHARDDDPGEPGGDWVIRFRTRGGTPAWQRLANDDERANLAREVVQELGVLDVEIQPGPLHPVVRIADHVDRADVLGTALRLLAAVRAGNAVVPELQVEKLAGMDHLDAADPVTYVRSLLEGADGELLARMLTSDGASGPAR